jgi:hypothetical protein
MSFQVSCPSCRRIHEVSEAFAPDTKCQRCMCELDALIQIKQAAYTRLDSSKKNLSANKYKKAVQDAEEAWSLYRMDEIADCGLIASVLLAESGLIRKWARRSNLGFITK